MQNDDIREQIKALRQEVRGLSTSILNLRQDDMRKVFGDQIETVLKDRIARHYSRVPDGSVKERQEEISKETLQDIVDRTVTIFQSDGKQRALTFLNAFETGIVTNGMSSSDRINSFELQLVDQIKEYLNGSDHIFNQTAPGIPVIPPIITKREKGKLSPETAERLLAPLSNAKRVQVMLILTRESNSLAELCKELGLKKGHLQFHLKALLEVEYIHYDRKSHLYSVTSRGLRVLDGITMLLEDISSNLVE
ncbi:MAG TPA: winged helix-turn-helix domain-containing protein [Methanomassiliicoccales archaeon]|jgi:DNA-binding transcriptional ArsR family regulator